MRIKQTIDTFLSDLQVIAGVDTNYVNLIYKEIMIATLPITESSFIEKGHFSFLNRRWYFQYQAKNNKLFLILQPAIQNARGYDVMCHSLQHSYLIYEYFYLMGIPIVPYYRFADYHMEKEVTGKCFSTYLFEDWKNRYNIDSERKCTLVTTNSKFIKEFSMERPEFSSRPIKNRYIKDVEVVSTKEGFIILESSNVDWRDTFLFIFNK